jgi:hypothetical protein
MKLMKVIHKRKNNMNSLLTRDRLHSQVGSEAGIDRIEITVGTT